MLPQQRGHARHRSARRGCAEVRRLCPGHPCPGHVWARHFWLRGTRPGHGRPRRSWPRDSRSSGFRPPGPRLRCSQVRHPHPRHPPPPQPLTPPAQRLLQNQPHTLGQPHLHAGGAARPRACGALPVRLAQLDRPPPVIAPGGEMHHHACVPDPPVHRRGERRRRVHDQQIPGPQQPRQLRERVMRHLGTPRHEQPYGVPVEPGPTLFDGHARGQLLRDPYGHGHRSSRRAGAP